MRAPALHAGPRERENMRRCLGVVTTLTVLAGVMSLASAPPPTAESASSAQLARSCSRGLVALTFDDGPRPRITRKVIRVLVRTHTPATFFVVGKQVGGHGKLLRQMRRH